MNLTQRIAEELQVKQEQVDAAVTLLDEGATVPFIARYRKEVTSGLDDAQLRELEERLGYLRELEERRSTIVKTIEEQGKLTPELQKEILTAETKTRLEDLYAPYKPKRRSKAQSAREAGLEPLLDALLEDPSNTPSELAEQYLNEEAGVADANAALEGARHIFTERVSEHADLIGELRQKVQDHGAVSAEVVEAKKEQGKTFADYFDYQEALKKIPSHRALALFRGRKEGVLRVKLQLPEEQEQLAHSLIKKHMNIRHGDHGGHKWLNDCVNWAWLTKVSQQIETERFMQLREAAEEEAIRVFGENLRDLLLAAPAGPKAAIGLDPGIRTGVKTVVVDATGKLLEHTTIYPHAPKNQWDASIHTLAGLIKKHQVSLISIGNGTASRETDRLAKDLQKRHPELKVTSLVVNEAGASVYSASELASKEFPDLDVSLRGAVSIARRLQDPLAELVKIDPKSIGVGQYQHDVNQSLLSRKLSAIVEDCVNAVGVDLNTASPALLAYVSGLSESIAKNIVNYRDENGAFQNREALRKVPRLGPKAFEQAAGFLRIANGDNPLDSSAVHPETYALVEKILNATQKPIKDLMGNTNVLNKLAANDFIDETFGAPTVKDVIDELKKPGRDPRPEFKTAQLLDGVETMADLNENMIIEGTVTNVTNFGAFVDIGVHQDGLVHISALTNKFIENPRDVVKTGDIVKVKVLAVDMERKRISLTMRLDESAEKPAHKSQKEKPQRGKNHQNSGKKSAKPAHRNRSSANSAPPPNTAMAQAFAKLKR